MTKGEINVLMARLALKGLKLVRLKGGDPSVFGPSGEERDDLEPRGVALEIMPGVTAASAAGAQFAFPVTHRAEARRLTFATARLRDGALVAEGWRDDPQTPLAMYLGRDCAGLISKRLIEDGRSPGAPALAAENAGCADARLLQAALASLPGVIDAAAPRGPVVLVIGAVAARARGEAMTANPALATVGGRS